MFYFTSVCVLVLRTQNKTYCSAIFNYVHFICTVYTSAFYFSRLIIYNFPFKHSFTSSDSC